MWLERFNKLAMFAAVSFFACALIATRAAAQTAGVDLKKPVKVKVKAKAKTKANANANANAKAKPIAKPKTESQFSAIQPSPVVAPPKESPLMNWSGSVDYRVRTDLADRAKPRLYVHTLDLSYGFEHTPSKVSVGASLGATYSSLGERRSEVIVNSNDAELFVNDLELSIGKSWDLPQDFKTSIDLGNEFPTSPEARREGYNSVTSLSADLRKAFFENYLSVTLSAGALYVWNSYRYSPATTDINQRSGTTATAKVKFKIWQGWYVNGSVGAKISTYVDGTSDQTYRNSIGTGYSWERLSISASYSNGTYLDQNDASLWFIDEYRRTASVGMSWQF